MLVDPVRRQRPHDVLVPPLVLARLLDPRLRDVPVVVDVVVVEDHHRRHGGEEPANIRVAPALEVQLRVVLEVEHPLTGRLGWVALGLDERLRAGRHLVGVDLVAEHQQHVGPALTRLVAHAQGHGAQGIDLAPPQVMVLLQRERRLVRRRHAAGSERDLERLLLRVGVEGARGKAVVPRPDALAVELHLVLVPAAGLEATAADERVVVIAHAERALLSAEDFHLARFVGLDPQHGLGLGHVSEQGSKYERGHASTVPRGVAFGSWSRSFRRWGGPSTPHFPGSRGILCARSTSGRCSSPPTTRSCARRCSASWM